MAITWTNSSLSAFAICGERGRRQYIEREYAGTRPRLVRGSAFAHGTRTAMMQKMQEQTLPTVEELTDVVGDQFNARWDNEDVILEPSERDAGVDAVRGYQHDLATDLIGLYRRETAPSIDPIAVERRIVVKPRDMNIELSGQVDLAARYRTTGTIIYDDKTSEKSPNTNAATVSPQLSMYALVWKAEKGSLPDALQLNHHVRTPAKRDLKLVQQPTTRDDEDMRVVVARLNATIEAVEAGRFIPAPADAWQCSEAWCQYWSTCPFTRRGERRPTS